MRRIEVNASTRRVLVPILMIIGVVGLGLLISFFLLTKVRFAMPFDDVYKVKASFVTAQAMTADTNQPVTVAGISVGTVSDVKLKDGRAEVTMRIDRKKLSHVYENATALLTPRTAAKDMEVRLNPGAKPAPEVKDGQALPLAATRISVDIDAITHSLDADTRAYFVSLLNSVADGTKGQSGNLQKLITSLGPTASQMRQISRATASQRNEIRALAQTVSVLAKQSAASAPTYERVIKSADKVLAAVSDHRQDVNSIIENAAPTLTSAKDILNSVEALAPATQQLSTNLVPTLTKIPPRIDKAQKLIDKLNPIVDKQIKQTLPTVKKLLPATDKALTNTDKLLPATKRLIGAAGYATNVLAYENQDGNGKKGYRFWIPWLIHNINSVASTADANGPIFRVIPVLNCESLNDPVIRKLLNALAGPTFRSACGKAGFISGSGGRD